MEQVTETTEEAEEIGEIGETVEGSCDDLPLDKSLREKIMSFLGCGGAEIAPADQPEPEVEVTMEVNEETPEEESTEEDIADENSIKAVVQSFLGMEEEEAKEVVEEPIHSEEPAAEDVSKTEEHTVPSEDLELVPEKPSLKERIVDFFKKPEDADDSETIIEAQEISVEEEISVAEEISVQEEPISESEIKEENSIKATLRNILAGSDPVNSEETEDNVEESVADVPKEIFEEGVEEVIDDSEIVEEKETSIKSKIIGLFKTSESEEQPQTIDEEAEITLEEQIPDKPSFKERILNFFKRSEPVVEVIKEEVETELKEPVPEIKESRKIRIGNFFSIFQTKSAVSDLESEIAESIVTGDVDEMMKNSEKEPIVIDTIGLCPEITRDNWLQLFMGRSFLCFVSFSLNLSILIASYLLYF
eukprot:GFUD01025447.1.p1 GENE.GFUD01025447.1~~GFUD01025447.1.p1  ORF type:complete len:484 (+),score=180.40 GFUD01025447.1:197-1453(+)